MVCKDLIMWAGSTVPAYSLLPATYNNIRQLTALGACFVLSCICIFACDVSMPITFSPWFFHSEKTSLKAQLKCLIYKRLSLTTNTPKQLDFPFSVIPLLQQSDHRIVVCPRLPHVTTIQLNRDMYYSLLSS